MSVVEYGCGDGNQLKMATYPQYLGFDVSPAAISMCKSVFNGDATKQFRLMSEYAGESAELTLSLDVIYHLVKDDVFESYMRRLFVSATRFVIVYSSNSDESLDTEATDVRHRKFTGWIETDAPGWTLAQRIANKFPYRGDHRKGSFADFYIYRRGDRAHRSILAVCMAATNGVTLRRRSSPGIGTSLLPPRRAVADIGQARLAKAAVEGLDVGIVRRFVGPGSSRVIFMC